MAAFQILTFIKKSQRGIVMKKSILGLGAFVGVGLIAGNAMAFTCPALQKGANESIAKAEAAAANITDEREKGRAFTKRRAPRKTRSFITMLKRRRRPRRRLPIK